MFSIKKTMEVLEDPETYAPHVRREAANRAIGILDKLAENDTDIHLTSSFSGRATESACKCKHGDFDLSPYCRNCGGSPPAA